MNVLNIHSIRGFLLTTFILQSHIEILPVSPIDTLIFKALNPIAQCMCSHYSFPKTQEKWKKKKKEVVFGDCICDMASPASGERGLFSLVFCSQQGTWRREHRWMARRPAWTIRCWYSAWGNPCISSGMCCCTEPVMGSGSGSSA